MSFGSKSVTPTPARQSTAAVRAPRRWGALIISIVTTATSPWLFRARAAKARPRSRERGQPALRLKRSNKFRQRRKYGSESTSIRIQTRIQQALALTLVRKARFQQAAHRRPQSETGAEGPLRQRRRFADRDRPRREPAADHHLHVAAGHHHRAQRRGD